MDQTRSIIAAVLVVAVLATGGWLCYEAIQAERDRTKLEASQQVINAVIQRVDERIVDLPEDGGAWYTTVFVHDDWKNRANERQLVAWFEANDRLTSLKAQTHWNVHMPKDEMYRSRWSKSVTVMPCVLVQKSDGKVVYKASGDNIPANPDQLADDIIAMFPCPRPTPTPKPVPDTNPVVPDTVPDIVPDTPKPVDAGGGNATVLVILVTVIAIVLGVFVTLGQHIGNAFRGKGF